MKVRAMALHLVHKCVNLEAKVAKVEETERLAAKVKCLERRLSDAQYVIEKDPVIARESLKEKVNPSEALEGCPGPGYTGGSTKRETPRMT